MREEPAAGQSSLRGRESQRETKRTLILSSIHSFFSANLSTPSRCRQSVSQLPT